MTTRSFQIEHHQGPFSRRLPARVAYTAADGTPRVYTAYFVWNGPELVMGTYAGAFKIRALRERPDVAITIDTDGVPPQALCCAVGQR